MNTTFVGVDLGGTGTRIVRTGADGEVLADWSGPTATEDAAATLLDALAPLVDSSVAGIGIGASGPVDADGVIRNPDSLPAYTGVDLVGELAQRLGVPVLIDNDAVTAAWAEAHLGAGRGYDRVLTVTLGTGVGVALLDHDRPWRTAAGTHPEAGHLTVSGAAPCYCGRGACWEQTASRAALQRTAAPAGLDLPALADQALDGDPGCRAIFAAYGAAVAEGLVDLLTALGPEVVVLGGGGARYLGLYRARLLDALGSVHGCFTPPPIAGAELGDLAGATGAALLAATAHSSTR